MKKFQTSTRELSLAQANASLPHVVNKQKRLFLIVRFSDSFLINLEDGVLVSLVHNRTKLTLTRPKEPEFVTSQRACPLKVKSSAELEEEMLARIPKFKARPVNKKVMYYLFHCGIREI